jgi:putative membrane protein
MSNTSNFSELSRQSPKGILVIYFGLLFKTLKLTWVLIFIFIRRITQIPADKIIFFYLFIAAILVFLFVRAYLTYRAFQFKIENNYFILQQGILKKTNMAIPFDRIQNINFKQNIIQQLINVYQVNLETAGSNTTEIDIKALNYKDAQLLKEQMSLQKNDNEEAVKLEDNKPLLTINFKELLKVSVTENHLQSLLIFTALLFGLFQQVKDAFNGLGKDEEFNKYLEVDSNALFSNLIVLLFILVLLIGFISSFVRVLLFHFNLSVFIRNESFEINQGLLTKKSIILKKEKVQNITISTNPIKKLLGISFVVFKQAVSGKVNQKQNKQIKIVGCKAHQIQIIKDLLFNFKYVEASEKEKPDTYYKARMYVRSFIGLLIINSIGYGLLLTFSWFFINLGLIPLSILLIHLKYKKQYYKFDDDLLLIGSGRIETHNTYLPFFKVQNIQIRQTIFQQRKNIVDIVFQTASGKITIPCLKAAEAYKIYNYTLYKVQTSTNSWM